MDFIKKIILYLPSQIFKFIISLRIYLYEKKILTSNKYSVKIISIGNLIMGGAGKTPTVEYVADYLVKNNKDFAIISRGYKRKTRGMIIVSDSDSYLTVGDEPMQYFKKFGKQSKIIVSEDRKIALDYCQKNSISFVILDDAFQNLSFDKDLNILVTSFNRPFFYDDLFPVGMLRESKNKARRADVLVFSNTPQKIDVQKKIRFTNKANYYLKPNTPIFFSKVKYKTPSKIFGKKLSKKVIIISSIAYPEAFIDYVQSKYDVIRSVKFKDHHIYSEKEIKEISHGLDENISLLTTEKDAVKLCEFPHLLSSYNVYYLPIFIQFADDRSLSESIVNL